MRGVWQRLPKLAGESGTLDDDESMRDRCEKALRRNWVVVTRVFSRIVVFT